MMSFIGLGKVSSYAFSLGGAAAMRESGNLYGLGLDVFQLFFMLDGLTVKLVNQAVNCGVQV